MHARNKKITLNFTDDIYNLLINYSNNNNINIENAIEELIKKGYEYHELEKMYEKNVHNREVWDKRFYFLKIESAYLYYRVFYNLFSN